MVRIRLKRVGAKRRPFYRVVITDQRAAVNGPIIENIGHYNPNSEPSEITIKKERALHWIGVGARPSDSVASLLKRANIIE